MTIKGQLLESRRNPLTVIRSRIGAYFAITRFLEG